MSHTERARIAPRRIRIRKTRVAGLLVVIAAITALSLESRASSSARDSSSSTAAAPIHVLRRERPGRLSETGGAASTGRLGLGEADGAVPDGTTVFDNEVPGVAKRNAVDIGPSGAAAWLSEHGAAYGLCQIYGNEPWHYELRPEAGDHGCPAMYADPTHDPRMQQ